ncbi:bifunctional 2-polyprenyl-6-hydroxyphenol methylase/3-demethylubiquinol 3-O-methyltransferase UbiG [Streptomyces sp. UNOC14_S4]|uniref:class I SAM-dependent methyltransferase n=1 Tax=Streptomyces sp. UNOC14_S4 TaxID=2872340 RepID=UPI001E359D3F|nr:class I SAM-dependent methyltransferase [Streptomyces sp. UNOC14_S4]MCC3766000.1 class I SAM-dependent methyltransferase [Streptomyces sp. UNOC14_S4]
MARTNQLHHTFSADAQVNTAAWNGIADQLTPCDGPAEVPDHIEWTSWPGHGPDHDFLGDVSGKRVAELGCGTGEHTAYMAAHGAALAVGVDIAQHRIKQAQERYGHLAGIQWEVGDAIEATAHLPKIDICISIYGALWYADPALLLPVIRNRLKVGGVLAFTVNALRTGQVPGRRVDNLTLPDGIRLPVVYYSYALPTWRYLLQEAELTLDTALTVDDPTGGGHQALVLRAHRPAET